MFTHTFYNHWDYWNINPKVTFDGINKLIVISSYIHDIDVKNDLYSAWKEWISLRDNAKFEQAFKAVGGDTLPGGQFLGSTYFLINDWKIRTWEGNHNLTVTGNLYREDGTSPFINTIEKWNIIINSTVSNIVQSINSASGVLTPEQNAKLMSLPNLTLTLEEHDKLMSLINSGSLDVQTIIDGVWNKVLPNGQTAKEYIVYKLLTTNKFIALQ